jgi:hypothetical protein
MSLQWKVEMGNGYWYFERGSARGLDSETREALVPAASNAKLRLMFPRPTQSLSIEH